MICPHCSISIHDTWKTIFEGKDSEGNWDIQIQTCPSCRKFIVKLNKYEMIECEDMFYQSLCFETVIYPKHKNISSLQPEVPKKYANDYIEALITLDLSPKASAALSRRCLESLLQNEAMIDKGNLAMEINEAKKRKLFPSYIEDSLDQVRIIGKFAAHPIKSQTSGEIIDVQPGEAECNLNAIEHLFDHLFVQPEKRKRNKLAIEKKLNEAKKNPKLPKL